MTYVAHAGQKLRAAAIQSRHLHSEDHHSYSHGRSPRGLGLWCEPTMLQLTEPKLCDDCLGISRAVASLLRPDSKEKGIRLPFDAAYQARLSSNVASFTCHMCTLLQAAVLDPSEVSTIPPSHDLILLLVPHRPMRVDISLIEDNGGIQTHHGATLRVEDGKELLSIRIPCARNGTD
jgi:hypothetical protein